MRQHKMSLDEFVQATNNDATSSKSYAVHLKYWNDPFITEICRTQMKARAPEMNRGYWARVMSTKCIVEEYLSIYSGNLQVVNLGAGFCTLYLRLIEECNVPLPCAWADVDLPDTIAQKVRILVTRKALLHRLATVGSKSSSTESSEQGDADSDSDETTTEVQHNRNELHAPPYHVLPADLRLLKSVKDKLLPILDITKPTLFISECVLVYLPVADSSELLQWISETFQNAHFLCYEQVNMNDRFGQVMLENLRSRHGDLPGVDACKSLDSQRQRFLDNGWKSVEVWDMNTVYRSFPSKEIKRIERIEMLDEREVMEQLFGHYCLLLSTTNAESDFNKKTEESEGDTEVANKHKLQPFSLKNALLRSASSSSNSSADAARQSRKLPFAY